MRNKAAARPIICDLDQLTSILCIHCRLQKQPCIIQDAGSLWFSRHREAAGHLPTLVVLVNLPYVRAMFRRSHSDEQNKYTTRISRLTHSPFPFMQALSVKTSLTGILGDRTISPFRHLDKIGVSFFHSLQTGSGNGLASYSMGTGVSFPGTEAAGSPPLAHVQIQIHIYIHIHGGKRKLSLPSPRRTRGTAPLLRNLGTRLEWPTWCPGRFTSRITPGVHWIGGLVGTMAGLDDFEKRKPSCPWRDSNPGSSSPQPSTVFPGEESCKTEILKLKKKKFK